MRHGDLDAFLDRDGAILRRGPTAAIMAEDGVEIASTLRHHLGLGFGTVLLLAPAEIALPAEVEAQIHRIDHDVFAEAALVGAVNRLIPAAEGQWLHYAYNAEYLFFPFCETRSIRELVAFHAEERREAMLTAVVDLYAPDLDLHPDGVSPETAHLDRTGYSAEPRKDPARNWAPKERQRDLFGGLRWRFEEHVPWERRRIDRISLFRARRGVRLQPDFTFDDEEWNTAACAWHANLTAAVCSFRAAKALRANPGSRAAIRTFRWQNSVPFAWHSQQLMDLGLMEPGQWF